MEILKEKFFERRKLQIEKEKVAKRLDKAQVFFKTKRNQNQLMQANNLLIDITNKLHNCEKQIESLDVQIIERMEMLALGEIKITTNETKNELHENIPSSEFSLNKDSLEDMWVIKTAKKFFGVDENNIEVK